MWLGLRAGKPRGAPYHGTRCKIIVVTCPPPLSKCMDSVPSDRSRYRTDVGPSRKATLNISTSEWILASRRQVYSSPSEKSETTMVASIGRSSSTISPAATRPSSANPAHRPENGSSSLGTEGAGGRITTSSGNGSIVGHRSTATVAGVASANVGAFAAAGLTSVLATAGGADAMRAPTHSKNGVVASVPVFPWLGLYHACRLPNRSMSRSGGCSDTR
jgi:hypothetical protein